MAGRKSPLPSGQCSVIDFDRLAVNHASACGVLALAMLTISTSQLKRVERKRFIDKADAALAARVPEWAASPPADRRHFIELCLERGARYGLLSGQSVMA